jgi:DNA modification methylase
MEEKRVTVDGVTHPLPVPFVVLATQNPVGSAGTQNLPNSQLDRFIMKLQMGYPDLKSQIDILKDRGHGNPLDQVEPIMTREELVQLSTFLLAKLEAIHSSIVREKRPARSALHPTMKPVALCAKLIQNSSKRGDNVIDFFGGSGSTLMACEETGRNCYTIELDPKYADVIITRWEDATGERAVLLNGTE